MELIRDMHPDTYAAIAAGSFCPVVMVYLDWQSGPVYMHGNRGVVEWDGQDWLGVGAYGGVSAPPEETGMAQNVAQLTLFGVPGELAEYLAEPIRGRDAEILFGVVTERSGNILIGEPFSIFSGYMDARRLQIQRQGENAGIEWGVTLTAADGPSQIESAAVFHTNEDQQRRFPGDTAGRWVQIATRLSATLKWPG